MIMTMTDEPETDESNRIPVSESELKTVEDRNFIPRRARSERSESELKTVEENLEIIELKAINRMLIAACWDATQLRGIWTALNDPLALDMERRNLRDRYKQIELGIRVAIEKAESRMK